jgi:hypothetical protein
MKEALVDLWDLCGRVEVMCITTNGTVKNNGRAVMGRGCALEARTRFRDLDLHLGQLLQARGNVPQFLGYVTQHKTLLLAGDEDKLIGVRHSQLWSFPVKHTWNQKADVHLIRYSAHLLREAVGDADIEVVIPRPGCGNGGLDWEHDVRPALSTLLDSRFTIISKPVATPARAVG